MDRMGLIQTFSLSLKKEEFHVTAVVAGCTRHRRGKAQAPQGRPRPGIWGPHRPEGAISSRGWAGQGAEREPVSESPGEEVRAGRGPRDCRATWQAECRAWATRDSPGVGAGGRADSSQSCLRGFISSQTCFSLPSPG